MSREFSFEASVWLYDGKGSWHFITLPKGVANQITSDVALSKKAFGSVKVMVMLGGTRWKTSLFRDNARGSYLLPIKAEVRRREQLQAGMTVEVTVVVD